MDGIRKRATSSPLMPTVWRRSLSSCHDPTRIQSSFEVVKMNWLNIIVILIVAWLIIFFQSVFTGFRDLVGAQFDLLPALMVYTSLTAGMPGVIALAWVGGLGFDTLSANPLGVSVLPLFVIGWTIHCKRELILREELYAQHIFGLAASHLAPFSTVLLLFAAGGNPVHCLGFRWPLGLDAAPGTGAHPPFLSALHPVYRFL